jgi:carbonic anhydrase
MARTAPINIVPNSQTDKICKLKCAYQFIYPPSPLHITNAGSVILLSIDPPATPPVIYNDENYNVSICGLFAPSLHTFNGNKADAELIIVHANSANKQLYVCVPIKASSTSTADSASFFDMIIGEAAQTGGRAVYNNAAFTLNKFVPMAPFFAYTGTNMFASSGTGQIDYIVFNIKNAITMSPKALATLQKILPTPARVSNPVDESVNPGGLFYNPDGPTSPQGGDIYIDCRPTGDEGEVLVTARPDTSSMFDNISFKDAMNSNILKVIIGIILMIVLWKVMIKAVDGITASAIKMKGGGLSKLAGGGLSKLAGGGLSKLAGGGLSKLAGGGLSKLAGGGLSKLSGVIKK